MTRCGLDLVGHFNKIRIVLLYYRVKLLTSFPSLSRVLNLNVYPNKVIKKESLSTADTAGEGARQFVPLAKKDCASSGEPTIVIQNDITIRRFRNTW